MNLVINPISALDKIGVVHARLNSESHGNSGLFFSKDDGSTLLRSAVAKEWITFEDASELSKQIGSITFSTNGASPGMVILQAIKESEVAELIELVDSNFFDDLKEKVEGACPNCGEVHSQQIPGVVLNLLSALFGDRVELVNADAATGHE